MSRFNIQWYEVRDLFSEISKLCVAMCGIFIVLLLLSPAFAIYDQALWF